MPLPTYEDYYKDFPGHDLNHLLTTLRQISIPRLVKGGIAPNKHWRIQQAMAWDLKNPDRAEEAYEPHRAECQRVREAKAAKKATKNAKKYVKKKAKKASKKAKDTRTSESPTTDKAVDPDKETASEDNDGPAFDSADEMMNITDEDGISSDEEDYINHPNYTPEDDAELLGSQDSSIFGEDLFHSSLDVDMQDLRMDDAEASNSNDTGLPMAAGGFNTSTQQIRPTPYTHDSGDEIPDNIKTKYLAKYEQWKNEWDAKRYLTKLSRSLEAELRALEETANKINFTKFKLWKEENQLGNILTGKEVMEQARDGKLGFYPGPSTKDQNHRTVEGSNEV